MDVFSQMMRNQKDFWITITFGECCENRVGNQKIGEKAQSGEGFSIPDLIEAKNLFEKIGASCSLVDLSLSSLSSLSPLSSVTRSSELLENNAMLLVIHGGIDALLKGSNYNYLLLEKELKNCPWDKKALDPYGNVVNLNARYNLCFADSNQSANYEKGEGTVLAFSDLPILQYIRQALPNFIGEKAKNLLAEGNYYYDKHKCAISYHGDIERRKVIGLRIGATMPICYQWFQEGKPLGEPIKVELQSGDMYIMSERAVGTDNTKALALKHAAGFDKNIKIKTAACSNSELPQTLQQTLQQTHPPPQAQAQVQPPVQPPLPQPQSQPQPQIQQHQLQQAQIQPQQLHSLWDKDKNKKIYDLLYMRFPELRKVFDDVGVLDIDSLMKTPYPALLGVIIGQKISFKRAKELRQKMYTIMGGSDFTLHQFLLLQKKFTSFETYPIIERVNKYLQSKSDDFLYSEKNIKSLIEVDGIGDWTIKSTLLCCFTKLDECDADIFPSGDKFLQNALSTLNITNEKMSASLAKKISERWSPYRGYVTWYLWRWFPELRKAL